MVDYAKIREDLHKKFSNTFEKLAEHERLDTLQKDIYEQFHRELDRINGMEIK